MEMGRAVESILPQDNEISTRTNDTNSSKRNFEHLTDKNTSNTDHQSFGLLFTKDNQ